MSIQKSLFVLIVLLIFSCKGDDENSVVPEVNIPDDVYYYFIGEVNDENVELFFTLENEILVNPFDINGTPPNFTIDLLNHYHGPCGEELSQFKSLFSPTELGYSHNLDLNNNKEVVVSMYMEDGMFSSDYGEQSDAKFEITDVSESPLIPFAMDVEGALSCVVYNEDEPSQSFEIKNGRFKMPLQPSKIKTDSQHFPLGHLYPSKNYSCSCFWCVWDVVCIND